MFRGLSFQDLCDPNSLQYNEDGTSAQANFSPFPDTIPTPADKQHDVWGSSVFTLPDLGGDLDAEQIQQNNDKCNSNGNSQAAASHVCAPAQLATKDYQTTSLTADSKVNNGLTPNMYQSSFGSTRQQSTVPSVKGGATNAPMACPLVYTPLNNQLSVSSLMSLGTTTMPPNNNNTNNGLTYQQGSPVTTTLPGNVPTFFTTAQGGNNVVMFAPAPSPQTLCIPPGAPQMIPYYVFTQPQQGVEVNGAMTFSPMTGTPQAVGTILCTPWHPAAATAAGGAVGAAPSNAAGVSTTAPGMMPAFAAPLSAPAPQPLAAFPTTETNLNAAAAAPSLHTCSDAAAAQKPQPKGSPPSYDSVRLQLTKRRQPVGRQRSGTNVHGSLQGTCIYYSYNLSAALKQYEQPDSHPNKPGEQVLPVFIQMFPCELRDRTIIVLNRVVEATCGPDIATVVGIEPRSETSFIALVRTDRVWDLIHKLRCRVLMDRHGFWYAENFDQYMRLKEYCENVRRLPQQTRHFQTDGLPCMPLVVELSRSVDASAVTSPPADPSFDKVAPIATVERHLRVSTATGSNESGECSMQSDACDGSNRLVIETDLRPVGS
ncbi:hypothetical protein LSM04_009538 [Trypanosoma melophagium]|uniref:uncharacterized protein n=1 Tax=Trypanosoma melophagium TaxID=715481 RepID=UPI00351A37B6|nr:hypothetical protein LSM04_009538 [Trypanosoma melophagium]